MPASRLSLILLVSVWPVAISSAHAGCGDRPGTPNELRAEPLASAPNTTIRFSWRNTTGKGMNKSGSTSSGDAPHKMYFDIWVRDSKGRNIGKDLTGYGPYSVTYGSRSHKDINHLSTPETRCFYIRARTGPGTKGCISKIAAGPVCATTVAAAAKPPTGHTLRLPYIWVRRAARNSFRVSGRFFKHNAPVTIRVADAALTNIYIVTIGNKRILSNSSGSFVVRLFGLCKARGPLFFSANDGTRSTTDMTGTRWSNTAQQTCR